MADSADWHNLVSVQALEPGDVTEVQSGHLTLAVYDTADGVFVTDARCSHAGANLCDGYFDGRYIECPLHQGLFDIRSGLARAAPATRPLKVYAARVKNGMVQVQL